MELYKIKNAQRSVPPVPPVPPVPLLFHCSFVDSILWNSLRHEHWFNEKPLPFLFQAFSRAPKTFYFLFNLDLYAAAILGPYFPIFFFQFTRTNLWIILLSFFGQTLMKRPFVLNGSKKEESNKKNHQNMGIIILISSLYSIHIFNLSSIQLMNFLRDNYPWKAKYM